VLKQRTLEQDKDIIDLQDKIGIYEEWLLHCHTYLNANDGEDEINKDKDKDYLFT